MENSNCDKSVKMQGQHDEALSTIFHDEKKSINNFFDSVFGYFYRNFPEVIFDATKYGNQVVNSNYEKWQKQYLKTQKSPVTSSKRTKSEVPANEAKKSQMEGNCWYSAPNPGGPTHTTNTATTSSKRTSDGSNTFITESKKEVKEVVSALDTTYGSQLDKYAWTQTIDDLEMRVLVPKHIRKGNQVKIQILEKHLKVEYEDESSEMQTILEDDFMHPIRVDDSVWLLSPEQHISILLEKTEPIWWTRLLMSETPIDLSKLNLERSYSSLPEDERHHIEKAMADKLKKECGAPTSSEMNVQRILRKAWEAEGSPFKDQPFDPSLVNIVNPS